MVSNSATTRQMMIVAGSKPELCLWHGVRLHAKQEGGSSTPIYIACVAVCRSCPECGVHVLCLCRKVGLCEVTGEKKLTYMKAKDGDTDKEAQI